MLAILAILYIALQLGQLLSFDSLARIALRKAAPEDMPAVLTALSTWPWPVRRRR